jgi:protein LSM14
MSTGMPELGSKISLISKADIRYEGRLFTVDPIECTIALASVRSYGTEDRETQYPIVPQNQVYEYILFRGSDIKDIRVINSVALPNDPAIMQMHLPPTQQQFQQPQFPVPVMGHMGTPMNQSFGNMYASMSSSATGSNLAPGSGTLNKSKQQSTSGIDFISQSRSTTPTSSTRKSPTHDMATQANQSSNNSASKKGNRNRSQPRERRDSIKNDTTNHVDHKNQPRNQQFHGNNQRHWNSNNRGNNQMRGNRPRPRGPPMQQQAFTQSLQNKAPTKTALKIGQDYDFEEAHKKFEDLCLKKVGEEANPAQVNGEVDKKDDSGNETGAGEHEVEEDDVTVGYDKTKSFFDNISCEAATDRTKGKIHKDWRQERKINHETFGVSARRGGFFNFRGRGNYFIRNNIGGYRGNMGYNRGGNYRGRNYNNRNYNSQSTGIPQQSKNEPALNSAAVPVESTAGN